MHGSYEDQDAHNPDPQEPQQQRAHKRNPGIDSREVNEAVERARREAGDLMSKMTPLEVPESHWTFRYTRRPPTRNPLQLGLEIMRSIWAGKALAYRLFMRNLSSRYRQTLLGLVWIIIPTLAVIGTWWFLAKQQVLRSGFENSTDFIVYIAVGSVLWQTFFDAIQAPLRTVMGNSGIVTKINFPRESMVLVAIGEVLFDLSIRLVLVIGFAALFGISWSNLTLLAPLLLIGLILLGIAIGLFLTPVGILYQDISRALTVLSPFWMILTPVVYQKPDSKMYHIWNLLNPPAELLTATRELLIDGTISSFTPVWVWAALVIPLLMMGMVWYRLSFPIFLERIGN